MRNFAEQLSPENEDKKKKIDGWKKIFEHLDELKEFFLSDFVTQTRKTKKGFIRPEILESLNRIEDLKRKISAAQKEYGDDIHANDLDHIIGNSIGVTAGGFAKRFQDGKEMKIENVEKINADVKKLNEYIQILLENEKVFDWELKCFVGYLENFLDYFNCDLPTQTPKRIKVIKFFSELEQKGMKWEEFHLRGDEVNRETKNLINLHELGKKLVKVHVEVGGKEEEYYKLM